MAATKHKADSWETVGDRLAWLAREMGTTLPGLGEMCGLSAPAIGALATRSSGGKVAGKDETWYKIEDITGCSVRWLKTGWGKPFTDKSLYPLDQAIAEVRDELPGDFQVALRKWQEATEIKASAREWLAVIDGILEALGSVVPQDESWDEMAEDEPEPQPAPRQRPRLVQRPATQPPPRQLPPRGGTRQVATRPRNGATPIAGRRKTATQPQPAKRPVRNAAIESAPDEPQVARDVFDRTDHRQRPLPAGVVRRKPKARAS